MILRYPVASNAPSNVGARHLAPCTHKHGIWHYVHTNTHRQSNKHTPTHAHTHTHAPGLTKIDVARNALSNIGARHFARVLAKDILLQHLTLDDNTITGFSFSSFFTPPRQNLLRIPSRETNIQHYEISISKMKSPK